jgi:carboxypeptidase Taq
VSRSAPRELALLQERMAELADLHGIFGLLFWDQNTMMPPGGALARGDHLATLTRVAHERTTDPEVGRLLDALEPWAATQDPDGREARMVRWVRRDFEKTVRVPADLAAEMSRAKATGQQAWEEARAADDFAPFRDAFAHHVELRHRYIACFDAPDHPYDVLLDDFEPGLTTAELRPLFTELRDALVPLVAAAADGRAAPRPFGGPYPIHDQRAAVTAIAEAVGFDPATWRLDPSVHPFAQSLATTDVRLTTMYDEQDFGVTLYSVLHEFGHGLYESGVDPALARSPLGEPVSLGVHESQSRLWENFVGRSRPFVGWLHGRLDELLPGGLGHTDPTALYRALNAVRPSLIRIDADETTYNLHVILRFEIEVALMEGSLSVDDVPAAWDEATRRLLGVEVPGPAQGVLQDIHWSSGLMGYFPTYAIGNLMAAQLWERIRADVPAIDEQLARGDFAPLRGWLREHVHRHGRTFEPRELLRRVTGEELRVEPLVTYLRDKLADAGVLSPGAVHG